MNASLEDLDNHRKNLATAREKELGVH
jgi:hypothetical protein